MICHKKKIIFIHIPRTAGTSIEALVFDGEDAHTKAYKPGSEPAPPPRRNMPRKHRIISQYKPQYVEKYFSFSIVRNPWDKALSRYFWDKHNRRACVKPYSDFRSYIKARRGLAPDNWNIEGDQPHKYRTQFDYLAINNELAVDKVWKYERLDTEYSEIAERLGLQSLRLPHVFATTHEPYWTYYDQESIDIVADAYAVDIQAFDYKFLG